MNFASIIIILCAVGVGLLFLGYILIGLKRLFEYLKENGLRSLLELIFKKKIVFTILFVTALALGITSIFTITYYWVR